MGFDQLLQHSSLFLTYSDVFGKPVPKSELINEIQKIDIYEALNILSQLSSISNEEREKLSLIYINSINETNQERYVAFPDPNIHYAIKWFLAYGHEKSKIENVELKFPVFFHVLLITLMVADFMDGLDEDLDLNKIFLKSFLRENENYPGTTVARQEAFYFKILPNIQVQYPKDYMDIHSLFNSKYHYSIADYSNFLYGIGISALLERKTEQLADTSSYYKKPTQYLKDVMAANKIENLINDLSIEPLKLKEWALKTIDNYNDMDYFLKYPFFKKGSLLFPVSMVFLNYAGFDGLFFKIKEAMPNRKEEQRLFTLFGRLFEAYVEQLITASANASKIPYKLIPEFPFKYKKQNQKSSDVYLQLGKQILVIECKGKRILRDTKLFANGEAAIDDFNKVVVIPINQAATRMHQLKEIEKFDKKLKATILAVSYNGYPKVEALNRYVPSIPTNYILDYVSISEIEYIASFIEYASKGNTIFKCIKNKIDREDYVPYSIVMYRELEKAKIKSRLSNTRPAYINKMMKNGFSRLEENLKNNN